MDERYERGERSHHWVDRSTGTIVVTGADDDPARVVAEANSDAAAAKNTTPANVDVEMWRRVAVLLGVRSREAARDKLALMDADARRALQSDIDALRTRAAELAALDPVPEDYTDDKHWETPDR